MKKIKFERGSNSIEFEIETDGRSYNKNYTMSVKSSFNLVPDYSRSNDINDIDQFVDQQMSKFFEHVKNSQDIEKIAEEAIESYKKKYLHMVENE